MRRMLFQRVCSGVIVKMIKCKVRRMSWCDGNQQNTKSHSVLTPLKMRVCVRVNEKHGLYISFEHTQRHANHPHNREKFRHHVMYSTDTDYPHSLRGHGFANLTLVQENSVWEKVFIFKSIHLASWSDAEHKQSKAYQKTMLLYARVTSVRTPHPFHVSSRSSFGHEFPFWFLHF